MNSTWCVTSYPTAVSIYNQINNILNYVLQFLTNLLSTIILVVLIIKKRIGALAEAKPTDELTKRSLYVTIRIYIQLIIEKRELIIPPLLTMLPQLFSSPQFILSLSLACQDLSVSWHRYLLIVSYFVTYLPQVIAYKLYISPSSFYTDEFRATRLYHRLTRWQRLFRSSI